MRLTNPQVDAIKRAKRLLHVHRSCEGGFASAGRFPARHSSLSAFRPSLSACDARIHPHHWLAEWSASSIGDGPAT